jgi:membrane dipeptidase
MTHPTSPSDRSGIYLTDAMIRAIGERGGVIGINFFDKFLLPYDVYGKRRATIADVVAHMKHICDLTGSVDHVAIGTDMDGGLGRDQIPQEIITAADLPKVGEALTKAGFAAADVTKVLSGNWQRVIGRLR